jgi:hypothetical protein
VVLPKIALLGSFLWGSSVSCNHFPLRAASAEGAPSQPLPDFQFIYIDANVGGSSGGHSALRLGNTVYHFQYFPDGLFKLVRERWPHFRYIYNDLENRTLYVAHIHGGRRLSKASGIPEPVLSDSGGPYGASGKTDSGRQPSKRSEPRSPSKCPSTGRGYFPFEEPSDHISVQLRSAVIKAHGEDYLSKYHRKFWTRDYGKYPCGPRDESDSDRQRGLPRAHGQFIQKICRKQT